ncbi:MAG: triose-phosphate isomerase [Oligoflexia bacterium]|nr:triose-phosphate isomerase [Oligoflexia bacterium]
MRRKVIAGNWKMHFSPLETEKFLNELVPLLENKAGLDWIVFPPSVSLFKAKEKLNKSFIKFGAQNCHQEQKGAFTGEISALMLKELGCQYCLVGHSERRQYFNETSMACNLKIKALINQGITPIYCVGETLKEREEGKTEKVLKEQITSGLKDINLNDSLVVAYEPVWAIGTGVVATPQQVEEAHKLIRLCLADTVFNQKRAAEISILYGGSVKPENSQELSMLSQVDGFLVGGASMVAKSFAQIGQIPL